MEIYIVYDKNSKEYAGYLFDLISTKENIITIGVLAQPNRTDKCPTR